MKTYQMCARCVMDTTASDISFNADGVCNYCADHLEISSHIVFKNQAEQAQELERLVERVKASGRGKPYDCVIGLSGGVDSSYALYLAVRCGLRPIAVHMDNGWNSELAQQNIENLVSKLKVDFYTHVIDWEEFRALQQAFFDADVVDVELLTDNALAGVNYHQALKYRLKYILAGTNQATEGMRMPPGWNWFKHDKKNIYSIWKRFGDGRRIRTFPGFGVLQSLYVVHLRGVRWISFLDYTQYNKAAVLKVLQREIDYRPYPYKHYESTFTRFYQGYLLPKKFGIDKRRVHFSTLIACGQMSRAEALRLLDQMPYHSEADLQLDIEYFLKKMGWTRDQLQSYLARGGKPHALYGTDLPLSNAVSRASRLSRRLRGRTSVLG